MGTGCHVVWRWAVRGSWHAAADCRQEEHFATSGADHREATLTLGEASLVRQPAGLRLYGPDLFVGVQRGGAYAAEGTYSR